MFGTAAGIGIAVGAYGVSFGVLSVSAGMSAAQACVMSMLVFTGASQFAFVGVLAGGGGAPARCRRRGRDDRRRSAAVRAGRRPGDRPARGGRAGCARRQRRPGMSWTALGALCAASYALKAVGPLLAGGRQLGPHVRRTLDLIAVPLLAALIVAQTLGDGHRIAIDARAAALAVAGVLVWRHAPFLVVVLVAAGTAALLRALG
jgi:predicted branched-subunit amino acid permease